MSEDCPRSVESLPAVPDLPPVPPPLQVAHDMSSAKHHSLFDSKEKTGSLLRFFGGTDKNKYEYVKDHATSDKSPTGWRHASARAKQFQDEINCAKENRD